MPRFAANLTMLFTEVPVLDRIEHAAAAGFNAVELLFPYGEEIPALRERLEQTGVELILINLPAGNFAAGERGFANDPRRTAEFREGVAAALEIAAALNVPRFNCLTGLTLADLSPEAQRAAAVENLTYAAEQTQAAGVRLGVEPLNPIDAPGFLISSTEEALSLIDEVNHPNLDLQYDVYHAQRVEGNLTATIAAAIGRIGHIQIADSPGRNQPGTGEINYPYLLDAIDNAGYDGWVSLEYTPRGGTESSLAWLREWGYWA